MTESPYQVYLYVGATPPEPPAGVTVRDITPADPTPESTLEALTVSGLSAADLRTRVLLIVDPSYRDKAVLMYAALSGFAGRRIDFTDLTEVVDARSVHARAVEAPDLGKPDELPEFVQVGAIHLEHPAGCLMELDEVTEENATLVRYARHARLVLGDRSVKQSLLLLLAMAGLRVRNGGDRMPLLADNAEPFQPTVTDGDDEEALVVVSGGVDLDALRRAASEIRRSRRTDDRGVIVERVPETVRQARLSSAAAVPAEVVLERLGSYRNEETGFWRCPRPERHKNGDANPSTRVSDGLVRCFRCDLEAADVLRLVADCQGVSPDEAADWLLAPQA